MEQCNDSRSLTPPLDIKSLGVGMKSKTNGKDSAANLILNSSLYCDESDIVINKSNTFDSLHESTTPIHTSKSR